MPNDPPDSSPMTDGERYRARLMDYVKDKDPLAIQRETPSALAGLIEGHQPEKLKQPPVPGKWSIGQILAHLAEAELASGWRYRQMIERSGAPLSAFDQAEWARLGSYDSRDPKESLELFRLLREANLRMFANLTPEEWQRFGVHAERGRMTVKDLASQVAGHDVSHIEQIRQISAAV
jgi:DinB family protein